MKLPTALAAQDPRAALWLLQASESRSFVPLETRPEPKPRNRLPCNYEVIHVIDAGDA